MITLRNLSKSYGRRVLFEKINLTINRGEKIGLIGPNGAGKSTLFSIILDKEELSTGHVQINKNIHIGYLPQEAAFTSKISVLSEVIRGDETLMRLASEKEILEKEGQAGLKRYGEVLHELEFRGYFDLGHKAKKILMGLGFSEQDLSRPVNQLSGGWQMRVLLAKLLTCHYDILLLDEPMNHLDLKAVFWFKEYLANLKETFIIISHDKDFLDEITNHILVLENSLIVKTKGNYEDYQRIQREKRTHLLKQFAEQEKKCKQLKKFVDRFHGQPNKASQVRAKKRVLEKMETIIVPLSRQDSIRNFTFPGVKRSGYRAITLKGISKSYDNIKVYENFDFEITRQEKVVLVGENGAGKSTLLKILAGVVNIDKGVRSLGHNTDIGYFSQQRMEILNPHNTVFEEAYSASAGTLSGERIRTVLSLFLFIGDDVDKKVTVLSGGEKSRLNLAKLLINPPNFLLLDEPTTHLDVDAVEALITALKTYEGTLIFISHNIHFVRSIANAVVEVKAGKIREFPGSFDYYWRRINEAASSKKNQNDKLKLKISGLKQAGKTKDLWKKKEDSGGNKEHNAKLAKTITNLRKEKEKLALEQYAKGRTLSNPRSYHSEETKKEYHCRLKKIKDRISQIDQEIIKLKSSFT
ncbi:MAG: ABC-F family ATP-binding cassette domain-containing protein [Candidatus Omnitrophica bacterium]|nr:ABC-F family ATP-binding cassette domain-containing protein [Candidatus Omnitrophota bacterium]